MYVPQWIRVLGQNLSAEHGVVVIANGSPSARHARTDADAAPPTATQHHGS